jgi:hypothetical protein
MTRARDTADTQDNIGGAVPPCVAGKNLLINGGFDIWQRGTTFNNAQTLDYTTDRWFAFNDSVNAMNVTQQSIASSGLGVRYAMRVERSSGTARWTIINMAEGALSLIGKTITFSGYVRKGAGLTSQVNIDCGTRASKFGAQYDAISTIVLPAASLSTTTWTKFSGTFNITTATSTNNADFFEIEITGASQAGATGAYFELAALQLEIGAVATPFARAGGSIGGELALCQRYFWQAFSNLSYASIAPTNYDNSGVAVATMQFPVTMRVAPTLVTTTGTGYFNWRAYNGSSVTNQSINSGFSTDISTTTACAFYKDSLTTFAGGSGRFIIGNSSATLGFSAEL